MDCAPVFVSYPHILHCSSTVTACSRRVMPPILALPAHSVACVKIRVFPEKLVAVLDKFGWYDTIRTLRENSCPGLGNRGGYLLSKGFFYFQCSATQILYRILFPGCGKQICWSSVLATVSGTHTGDAILPLFARSLP
jgi:hypothetical protein